MNQALSTLADDCGRSRAAGVTGAYKVDISRGERLGRVSSKWFSRPDDERYLSLGALHDAVRTAPPPAPSKAATSASKPAATIPSG